MGASDRMPRTEGEATLEEKLGAIERRFHAVINGRCGTLDWAKDPDREMPAIAGDLIGREKREWFPVPGFYGGFAYSLTLDEEEPVLTVESWCRIWDGSGQRHIITSDSTDLVEKGFV